MTPWRRDAVAQKLIDEAALPEGLTAEAFVGHNPDTLHLVARQGVGRRFDVRASRAYVDDAGVGRTVARGLDLIKGRYARSEIPEVAPSGEVPYLQLTARELPEH